MTSRSDSGVAGWGLTKTELRTAGGQGKWDRAVETWERGACLPHLSPHEHQGVAPPGPGRSRDMCDPNSVSPLTAGPGWCEGWQTALFEGTFSYYRLLVFAPFSLLSGDPASPSTEIQLQASPPPTSWPQPSTDKAHSQRGQAPAGSQRKGASSVITPPRTGLPGPGERWVRGKQYLVTHTGETSYALTTVSPHPRWLNLGKHSLPCPCSLGVLYTLI